MELKMLAGVLPLLRSLVRFWQIILDGRFGGIMLLLFIMCLAALMEMATLASVLPLVGLLINAGDTGTGQFVSRIPAAIADSEHVLLVVLGGIVTIVCVSALLRVVVLRLSAGYTATLGLKLQTSYLRIVLGAEYEDVINESSSRKISMLSSKIPYIVSTYVLGALNLATAVISATGILLMLLWLSTGMVFVALLVLTSVYALVAYFSRKKLRFHGRNLALNSPRSIQYLQDSLGGIRDVIMASSQNFYIDQYSDVAGSVEVSRARLVFYSGFPRPVLEAIGISSIAVIAYFINKGSASGVVLLPMLGAFSLGLLRLLPFIQQIFALWSKMYHAQPMLNEVMQVMGEFRQQGQSCTAQDPDRIPALGFARSIELRDADFRYQGADSPVLEKINLRIDKGDYVGITGPTGSGKSTLVDLLMGLLTPGAGELRVDGTLIDARNRRQWRSKVAHVPQRVYLAEGSIEENIAFAVPAGQSDRQRLLDSARRAHISEFIETLPDGYQTQTGENGVRLSGGQRQRIGIARALYACCEVLVLDEATNALDKQTEQRIIEDLLKLGDALTIITVAHNVEAVRHCRRILKVVDGSVQWMENRDS